MFLCYHARGFCEVWNFNLLSFWQFSRVCEDECAAFCSRAAFPPPVWVWFNQDNPQTFLVCSHTGEIFPIIQKLLACCRMRFGASFIISKWIRLCVAALAGSAFPPGESHWLREPGVWSWPSVYVQVDGQLALPAGMALPEPVLPPAAAGRPPAHPDTLRSSPLEEVRLILAVPGFIVGVVAGDGHGGQNGVKLSFLHRQSNGK